MSDSEHRTDDLVRQLAESVTPGRWPGRAELQRTAERRRRRRWLAGGTGTVAAIAVAVALVVALLPSSGRGPRTASAPPTTTGTNTTGPNTTGPNPSGSPSVAGAVQLMAQAGPPVPSDPSDRGAVSAAEQAFAFRLLDGLSGTPTANLTVSPMSLALALAMLENGAAGSTLTQLAATLGSSALSPAAQDQGWANLVAALGADAAAGHITLHSANALWLQKGLSMDTPFMSALARYYATGVWQTDFASDPAAATAAINAWVKQMTVGKIPTLFSPGSLTPQTLLVLANALYLDASWQEPFDPTESEPAPFHVSATETTTPTFMHGQAQGAVTSGYEVADLPYQGGRLSGVVVMPTTGSLSGFVRTLTPTSLTSLVDSATGAYNIELPRFTTETTLDLDPVLAALGMPGAFSGADFSAMSPTPMSVQAVVQRDYLQVGEKGTVAAAATGIAVGASAREAVPSVDLDFDHPFLFVVRDNSTGVILFASLIDNPES